MAKKKKNKYKKKPKPKFKYQHKRQNQVPQKKDCNQKKSENLRINDKTMENQNIALVGKNGIRESLMVLNHLHILVYRYFLCDQPQISQMVRKQRKMKNFCKRLHEQLPIF
ncbi:hypothetical protein Glove_21g157 [Diversispora epigaea]|uniref:Uncharacterized protein n=1 Tax=Diversispora epigaea TaxID=1348612 RepID=A0A397JK09_9GLOM|nr:hypothetical protein Glove_21g157 [Diversispora epigaea]